MANGGHKKTSGQAKGGQAYVILLFTLSAFTTFSLEDFLCLKSFVYFISPRGLWISLSSTSPGSPWGHIIFFISNHLARSSLPTISWRSLSCCFKSGWHSFIWWVLVFALVETVVDLYSSSYLWFCTHLLCIPWFFFFFSLPDWRVWYSIASHRVQPCPSLSFL